MNFSSRCNLRVPCVSVAKGLLKPQTRRSHGGCRQKTLLIPLVLLLSLAASHAQNGTRELFQPFVLREDFQGDSLGQWASYPPAQDIGYEPSLSPTSAFGAPGGRALMRIVKPNRVGTQRFGFIKKVRMAAGGDSRLRFSYRINSPQPATLEIGLAGVDGRAYTKILNTKTNAWTIADVSAAQLGALNQTRIEAIYIVTTIENVDPDFTYRFILDDLNVSALRAASFDVQLPRTGLIEPWPELISEKSYRAGETITLAARAPAAMASVKCFLKTQTGKTLAAEPLYDDGTHGDKTARDGIWTNDKLHDVQASDPSGIWLATLHGTTNSGRSVSTDVRLLVRPSNAATHPQLFFSGTDREKLLARTRDPKTAPLWSHLQATARSTRESGEVAHGGDVFELLDKEYLLPSLLGYFDVLNRARTRIAYNSFEAYLAGNAEARAAAKSALLDVARWQRWEPPWFTAHGQHTYYPAGQLATEVALGYDLLYSELTESERALVRDALLEKSIVPTFKEYVADNRLMANTSNWIAHTVGGALIAAASIANDVPANDGRFALLVNGLLRKLEDHVAASYLADGSYGEGISYHEFDAETLGPAFVALQRAFGVDYWQQTHVLESLSYPLYTLAQPVSSPDMGDTHPPAGHGIGPIVYRSKDPVWRWYYSQFDRPSLTKFIFYDDSIAPAAPKLPTSKIFSDKGHAVFRTGWNGDDVVFLFRAGPNFNHHHADQGSFLLTAFGEVLIGEAGWSDYYKDPYYVTFFTQAIGHNTVLVGGDPESQTIADTPQFKALDSYPRITDSITSDFYDSVASELSPVYQKRLSRYTRSIVFVKPHYFVVFDDLKTRGEPQQFDLLFHLADRDRVKAEGLTAVFRGEKGSLAVRVFAGNEAKLGIENGRIPYPVFALRTPAKTPSQPAYLDVRTSSPANETQFLTALVPARTESAARSLIEQITEIGGEGFRGVAVERGKKKDQVLFRVGASPQTLRHEAWSTDAETLAITENGSALELIAVQRARVLSRGERVLFSSESPVNLCARFDESEAEASINTRTTARVTLFLGKSPSAVLLDGANLDASQFSFNSSQGTISLNVPGGQHQLKIRLR